VLFFFLFNTAFQVPISFFDGVFADDQSYHELVAVLVSDTIYDDIEDEIIRYGKDIQAVLPNTKALIIPTPDDVSVFEVASLLEGLYYNGHKNLDPEVDYQSRLVGTVLVGDIPVPLVYQDGTFAKTILPYVDFKDKLYNYSHSEDKYIKSPRNRDGIMAEIWHGVIAPNPNLLTLEWEELSEDELYDKKIDELEQYFAKDHDFYRGQWLFQAEKWVLSWNLEDTLPEEYEPYVFYYNQALEQKWINPQKYIAYQAWLENREDIAYNRFTSKLSNRIDSLINDTQDAEILALFNKVAPSLAGEFEQKEESQITATGWVTPAQQAGQSDIQSMPLILGNIKKYLEIFGGPTIADIRKWWLYAGRYAVDENNIRVDTIPRLVTLMDEYSVETMKALNNELENYLDEKVEWEWWLRSAIPLTYKVVESKYSGSDNRSDDQVIVDIDVDDGETDDRGPLIDACNTKVYTHFSYGLMWADVETTEQCSIYRGSTWNFRENGSDGYDFAGQTVEANRGRNVLLSAEDLELCGEELSATDSAITWWVTGYWGWNTPINLFGATGESWELQLGPHEISEAIVPLFDVIGSKKVVQDEIDTRAIIDNSIWGNPLIMDSTTSAWNPNRSSTCNHANYIQTYWFSPAETDSEPSKSEEAEYGGECEVSNEAELSDVTLSEAFSCNLEHEVVGWYNGQPLPLPGSCWLFDPGECERVICKFFDQEPYYDSGADPGEPWYCADMLIAWENPAGSCDIHNRRKNDVCLDKTLGWSTTSHIFAWGSTTDKGRQYKSPTSQELSIQSRSQLSPALPIDAERYVEFFGRGEVWYRRFFYPNFFRLFNWDEGSFEQRTIYGRIREYADEMSEHINGVIWELIPSDEINILDLIEGTWDMDKVASYSNMWDSIWRIPSIELLNAALYYQLSSPSNKYRYIFENYLNDQFDGLSTNVRELRDDTAFRAIPENKKLYEIVYLNAPGDSQNMFIKMSPEESSPSPYDAEIIELQNQQSVLLSKNVSGGSQLGQVPDSCSPKEWVALQDFIPSLGCQLGASSPDKIDLINQQISDSTPVYTPDPTTIENLTIWSYRIESLDDSNQIENSDRVQASDQVNIFLFDEAIGKASELTTIIGNINTSQQKLLIWVANYDGDYISPVYPIRLGISRAKQAVFAQSYTQNQLDSFVPLLPLQKSGIYELTITDADGNIGSYDFEVSSDEIAQVDIEFAATIIESNGSQVQNFISLEDRFGNRSRWELYNIEMEIDGRSLEFVGTLDKEKFVEQTFDGYKRFDLKSTENAGVSNIKIRILDRQGEELFKDSQSLRVVDTLEVGQAYGLETQTLPEMFVWEQSYDIEVQMLGQDGELLSDYNSIAQAEIHELYGQVTGFVLPRDEQNQRLENAVYTDLEHQSSSALEFVDGRAKFRVTTGQSSGEQLAISFYAPGLSSLDNFYIDILPEKSAYVDLTLSKSHIAMGMSVFRPDFPTIESSDDYAIVSVEMKDQFGNVVSNDNTTQLTLEIPDEYKNTIRVEQASTRVTSWVGRFKIIGDKIAAKAYFKVLAEWENIGDDIEITGQAPFEKEILDELVGMRTWDPKILSLLWKRFFTESGPDHYISIFPKKQYLLESEDFINLPTILQDQLEDIWDENNSYFIESIPYGIGRIETSYFWRQDTFDYETGEPETRRYNGLYSVLLWASYGDYTKPDYLAWDLLFDDANRSLGVTSVLNNPYEKNDVFQLSSKWWFSSVSKSSNLFQDIDFYPYINSDGKLEVSIYNNALHIYIGSLIYNISDAETSSCLLETQDILDCFWDETDSSQVVMKVLRDDMLSYESEASVVLKRLSWADLLQVSTQGIWSAFETLSFELDSSATDEVLVLNVADNWITVAQVALKLEDTQINTSSNKTLFEQKSKTLENTILGYFASSRYVSRTLEGDDFSQLRLSYKDQFETSKSLDEFHSESEHGFENAAELENVGWEKENKTLLSFSAGEHIWDAIKPYMSFSTIHLWDPVVGIRENFLAPILPWSWDEEEPVIVRGFDASIGTILGSRDDLEAYKLFDYNNDGYQDILLINLDGSLELLENSPISDRFRNRWSIADIIDIWDTSQVFTGDFSGDGYEDILFINNKSKPVILNNYKTTFHRYDLEDDLELQQTDIILARVFDMDTDDLSDMITMDSNGELNIYYSSDISEAQDSDDAMKNPAFTKNTIDAGIWLTLNEEVRSDGGIVYFDGLYQKKPLWSDKNNIDQTSEEILRKFDETAAILAEPGGSTPEGFGIWEEPDLTQAASSLIDSTLFEEVAYDPNNNSPDQLTRLQTSIGNDSGDSNGSNARSIQALWDITEQYGDDARLSEAAVWTTTTNFIRSAYAQYLWLDITKQFIKQGSGALASGSDIQVELKIKNARNTTFKNVVYMESVESLLEFDDQSLELSRDDIQVSKATQGYDFLLEGFDLAPSEEITITYSVSLLPVSFGYLEVGYFETDTLWDDIYGDVILKSDHQNCGWDFQLYASIDARLYQRDIGTPSCDPDKNQVPEFLLQNEIDEYGYVQVWVAEDRTAIYERVDEPNGIPDYIDEQGEEIKNAPVDRLLANSCLAPDAWGLATTQPTSFPTDLSQIVWHGTNVSNWEETSILWDISVSGEFINLPYDKTSEWPIKQPLWENVDLVANAWVFYEENGKWHADTFEWMRPWQVSKYAVAVSGWGHARSQPLWWAPDSGKTYGFMVSGLARNNVRNVEERTNVSFYDCGGWDLIWAITWDSDGDGIPDISDTNPNYNSSTSGIDEFNDNIDSLSESVDDIINGLCSWFGWWASYTMPLNWAPLAPGSDPTLFGYPILDGLRVDEGLPYFSTVTGFQTMCWTVPCCLPSTHPVTPLAYVPGTTCGVQSAGGQLWTWSVANNFRIYITPTLTGSAGAAFCYGGPSITAGESNPPGLSPIVPGWNCIVVAAPLFWGGDDDDVYQLDPASQWPVHWSGNSGGSAGGSEDDSQALGIVYGNCSGEAQVQDNQTENKLTTDYVENYLNFKQGPWAYNILPPSLQEQTRETLDFNIADDSDRWDTIGSGAGFWSLISAGPQSWSSDSIDLWVTLDTSKLDGGSFLDAIKIQNKSVAAFPDFLMDWVNRQINEIVTKLTDFPTFHIILPDFSALLDSDWSEFGDAVSKAASGGINIPDSSTWTLGIVSESQISGIQEAYEFLWQVPYINIEEEVVNIDLPWPAEDIDAVFAQWWLAADQWEEEIIKTKAEWLWANGSGGIDASNFLVDADSFVKTLRRNMQILKEYRDIPQDVSELLAIKQVWMEQIITAVEEISELMWGWIDRNGERFKNWIETYMLIKTILVSWGYIIEIFNTYNDQCQECRNERHDLQYFYWKLISIVIPDIPVIIFPKWPDIILDLHNVRVGLEIVLPDFNFNPRPLILPRIPVLDLPSDPSITLNIPAMPLLPSLVIPQLPRLPDIPTIDLPNLPQAPKIPKVLAAFEGVLNILRLVVKMVCIARKSFFVPEWRAWDQIALITERNGYLPTDFIDLRLPQFSFPFVDAIKTTAYVNLEYDTEFIIEASRSMSSVMRVFSNDIINKLRIGNINTNIGIDIPDNINVSPNLDGDVDISGYLPDDMVLFVAEGIANLAITLNEQKDYRVTSSDFISLAHNSLAQVSLPGIEQLDQIKSDFDDLANYSFAKEDAFIQALSEKNTQKFNVLKQILEEEKDQNQQLQIDMEKLFVSPLFTQIAQNSSDIEAYQQALDPYNASFIKAASNLVVGENKIASELKAQWEEIIDSIYNGTLAYSKQVYALESDVSLDPEETNSCQWGAASSHKRDYKWVFVSEKKAENDLTYRLFNYMEELSWDEEITQVDIDNDGDLDVLYLVEHTLYLKKNHSILSDKIYLADDPLEIETQDNKYYNGDVFYEVVDHFEEEIISSNFTNISFDAHANPDVNQYRLESSHFIENTAQSIESDNILFADLSDEVSNNLVRNKQVVDIFSDVYWQTFASEGSQDFVSEGSPDTTIVTNSYKNLNRISFVWDVSDAQLFTYEMKNLNQDISDNIVINIASGTPIYSAGDGVVISYIPATYTSNLAAKTLFIPRHSNRVFDQGIKILSIRNDLYVETSKEVILTGQDIRDYLNIALPYDSQILFYDSVAPKGINSRLEISYYDGTSFDLDARKLSSYTMSVDTSRPDELEVRLEQLNGYYYATLQAIHEGIGSTIANDVLLAPQLEADVFDPELSYDEDISLALLQTLRVDLSDSILEDSGIDNIEQVIIDTDTSVDSDGDGEADNDSDVTLDNFEQDDFINIVQTKRKLSLDFGPYRAPINTSIKITLIDAIWNEGFQEIPFEVYTPVPTIEAYDNQTLSWSIDENITDIPVSVYRYRQWGLSRLDLSDNFAFTPTGSWGLWDASWNWTGSWLTLSSSGASIASIGEYKGSIDSWALTSYRVENEQKYPKIILQNNWEDLYYHYPVMGTRSSISFVDSFEGIDQGWMYVRMLSTSWYSHYSLPALAPYSPWASVIYRSSNTLKQALFTLYPDGRLDSLNEFYDIEYSGNWDDVRFTLIDQNFDRPVAEIYYQLWDGYILDGQSHSQ